MKQKRSIPAERLTRIKQRAARKSRDTQQQTATTHHTVPFNRDRIGVRSKL
jgi:hypothetical protein